MVAPDPVTSGPVVSAVVPARNEEACLGACLQSLVGQVMKASSGKANPARVNEILKRKLSA